MNQHARANEPSMDDILASIRKIIAEDGPKDAAPTPVPVRASAAPEPASPVAPAPTVEAPASLSSKLNDAFGYAPGADASRAPATAARGRTPVKSAIDDDLADLLSEQPRQRAASSTAEVPLFGVPSQQKAESAASPIPSVSSAEGLRASDALVPKVAETVAAPAPLPGAAETPPAASSPPVEPVKPAPIVIAASPRLKPSIEATLPPRASAAAPPPPSLSSLSGIASSQPAASAPPPPKATVAGPVVIAAMPPVAKAKPVEKAAPVVIDAPVAVPAASEPAATPAVAKAAAPEPLLDEASAAAVASALGNLDAGLSAAIRPPAPEIIVAAVDVVPPKTQSGARGAAQEASLVPQPAGNAAAKADGAAESVFSKPSAFIGGVALTPVKSFDDTAAELLRPMLREWLDSNMPRIVERALKIEIAEVKQALPKPADTSVKPGNQS